jgi:hypothetical protein
MPPSAASSMAGRAGSTVAAPARAESGHVLHQLDGGVQAGWGDRPVG